MIEITQEKENIFRLRDRADSIATLVAGRTRALLFDTGCGIDAMKAAVRSVTNLPLIVIASHGHFDHIGGCREFQEVYLDPKDLGIPSLYDETTVRKWLRELAPAGEPGGRKCLNGSETDGKQDCADAGSPDIRYTDFRNIRKLTFSSVDLGGLVCQIVPLPGHTRGSVGVLVPEYRILLGSDALEPVSCLFFANHDSPKVQLDTLRRAEKMDFDVFYTSHSMKKYPHDLLEEMIEGIECCRGKRFYRYEYPRPPYGGGYFHLHSLKDDDGVGMIVGRMEDLDSLL